MKEIKAIIQPFRLSKVIDALKEIPHMPGVTVSEVKGFGRGRAESAADKETQWGILCVGRIKLETVVTDEMANHVVEIIQKHAHTGNIGDGKIFIHDVQDVVKIRTNERGSAAI